MVRGSLAQNAVDFVGREQAARERVMQCGD
jgi:hypothetical protein